jgi:hypothetical protein
MRRRLQAPDAVLVAAYLVLAVLAGRDLRRSAITVGACALVALSEGRLDPIGAEVGHTAGSRWFGTLAGVGLRLNTSV